MTCTVKSNCFTCNVSQFRNSNVVCLRDVLVPLYYAGFVAEISYDLMLFLRRTCDQCIINTDCGFCYVTSDPELAVNGSCLAAQRDQHGDVVSNESAYGRCHQSDLLEPLHWAYGFCPTNYAWMATFGLVLYLIFFAPGMSYHHVANTKQMLCQTGTYFDVSLFFCTGMFLLVSARLILHNVCYVLQNIKYINNK